MKKLAYPIKLTGDINWAPVSRKEEATIGVVVKRAIFKSPAEITISCETGGVNSDN